MPAARWKDTFDTTVEMLKSPTSPRSPTLTSPRLARKRFYMFLRRMLVFGIFCFSLYAIPSFFLLREGAFYEGLKTLPHLSDSESSSSLPGVCVVVATMDRNAQVLSALENWLSFPSSQLNEIIVVDWSSSVPFSQELLQTRVLNEENRVRVLRIEGQRSWMLSLAYNAGIRLCRREYVLKLDAESHLNNSFFDVNVLPPNTFKTGDWRLARDENELHLNGIVYIRRADFALVNGYDERIQTYGWDDTNLYERLVAANISLEHIRPEYVKHVEHSNALRIAHSPNGHSVLNHDFGPNFETQKNRRRSEILSPWSQTLIPATYRITGVVGPEIKAVMEYRPHSNVESTSDEMERSIHVEILKASLIKYVPSLWEISVSVDHLETMYREYTRLQPIMIVHVFNAIGDRLQAMAQAWAVCQKSGRALRVIWDDQGNHFQASYADLFEPHPDMEVWDSQSFDPREVYGNPNFLVLDFEQNSSWEARLVNTSSPLNLYIKLSSQEFYPEVPFELQSQFLKSLKPSIGVRNIIERMNLPQNISNWYGALATGDDDMWEAFAAIVEKLLANDATAQFLVHLDDIASTKLQRFHTNVKVVVLPAPVNCLQNEAPCVQQVLANMISLSKTKALLGTLRTTMTQITARINLVPCFTGREISTDTLLTSGWAEGKTARPGVCL
mmetsp:Transcript_18923/g.31047  ORF Transcript_18923/g.31047 Transcript_18923/m.31047 type:complete len:672 (+) Transcript_18923:120-2135(+)